jgi:hypothetical protein
VNSYIKDGVTRLLSISLWFIDYLQMNIKYSGMLIDETMFSKS